MKILCRKIIRNLTFLAKTYVNLLIVFNSLCVYYTENALLEINIIMSVLNIQPNLHLIQFTKFHIIQKMYNCLILYFW